MGFRPGFIYEFRPEFGIDKLLAAVQPVVAGEHEADGAGDREQQEAGGTEQFDRCV